jgi:predicted  nucleic acid-binding Zn-ribbon protein
MSERSHQFGELDKEQKTLSEQLTQLLVETEQERSHINIQHLELYDQLRRRPGGLAVTLLKGDECGACSIELASQMARRVRRGDVLTCPTCNRILHVQ